MGENVAKHTVVTLWVTTVHLHLVPLLSEKALKPLVQRIVALQLTDPLMNWRL